ncbi:hypothetical protein Ahy_A01g004304 [Arachis hypogaea]|uniref:DUF4283 domain-containing protein n=1 Tax=Arachis hypogaea TaxID=3818 RepID=A0A445EVN9_ARAHY|nr:hypothetical protein Ahy_A01g004304 [Arachis hypogaea]
MNQKIPYLDMVVGNGFDNLDPKKIAELVAEEYMSNQKFLEARKDLETLFNPKLSIKVTLKEYKDWCKPWKLSLIVKPLGENLNLQAVERWARKDRVRVIDLEENFFLIRFSNQEDYSYALFEGLWMIVDHYLLV